MSFELVDPAREALAELLRRALQSLQASGEPSLRASLDDAAFAALQAQVPAGDVQIRLNGTPGWMAHESAFPGVWLLSGHTGGGHCEVGVLPQLVVSSLEPCGPFVLPDSPVSGRLRCLQQALQARFAGSRHAPPPVFNLGIRGFDDEEYHQLDAWLGPSQIEARVGGPVECRVRDSTIRHLWRVDYRHCASGPWIRTLEHASLPEPLALAPAQLPRSIGQLARCLEQLGVAS